ncbi:Lon protease family protein [Desulfolutivibrio sulfoxidireducens]|uniref:Lon protease family protein n=1 Tax=Desulfolutivibrio sulfoxidireducens TaxID=2773299 RepID=UPI00159D97E5|nr:ATP-binding protein [Desulfolutivibrio sulfoxidireducens]QLA14746.1 AAA family ATPase [Desulfolutivibrio sulfoxidireducens]QLA18328.1 AAA family ATPase [Desulfolutivibrio sulfoxidireducens]
MTILLPPERLRTACDPVSIPAEDSRGIPEDPQALAKTQPRAHSALEMALAIKSREYNVYLAGDPHLGRTYFTRSFLDPAAATSATPPDLVYVHNFEDPDRPRIISLPAGQGRRLKAALAKTMADIRDDIPAHFEREAYVAKRQTLLRGFNSGRDELYADMEGRAKDEGFNLALDDQGALTLYPLLEGKVVSDEEFEHLEPGLKKELKAKGDRLLEEMGEYLRRISREERGLRDQEKSLDRETAAEVLDARLAPLGEEFGQTPALADYFKALREDMLDNVDVLAAPSGPGGQGGGPQSSPAHVGHAGLPGPGGHGDAGPLDDIFYRYEINLFVDNSQTRGAPVIVEDHPTYFNLMGCIERESELGALYTDFTLVKAGSLHRANGGFLIVKVDDLVQNPTAWEGLLRALRSGLARVEDPSEGAEHARTRTIEPEPLQLDVKVVLVGLDETYELLLYTDERFQKLFKLKAHLQDAMKRTPENTAILVSLLCRIIRAASLLPFDRDALAALVDHASLLAEDQEKLSLKLPLLRELMIEAEALARMGGADMVGRGHLARAVKARNYRAELFEEEYLAEYDREMLKVATSGTAVGRANGLSVRMIGDHAFGLPHQIACTVGVGHGGIMDLEREAELGGPIHTKGMMILKSYLVGRFAQDKPLVLTGSLCFEQSYAEVEGDSASGAELAALLSALAERPIRLCHAFTGAVSQSGAILAVGGVNEKIEGFFAVCRRRGLTGEQGVLLPADNVDNLMLDEEVVEAVRQGLFHIFPVRRIEEAMEILTGIPAGRRGADGSFPSGSLFGLVDERLTRLARLARRPAREDAWGPAAGPLGPGWPADQGGPAGTGRGPGK